MHEMHRGHELHRDLPDHRQRHGAVQLHPFQQRNAQHFEHQTKARFIVNGVDVTDDMAQIIGIQIVQKRQPLRLLDAHILTLVLHDLDRHQFVCRSVPRTNRSGKGAVHQHRQNFVFSAHHFARFCQLRIHSVQCLRSSFGHNHRHRRRRRRCS